MIDDAQYLPIHDFLGASPGGLRTGTAATRSTSATAAAAAASTSQTAATTFTFQSDQAR